jgi:hypothetical protein
MAKVQEEKQTAIDSMKALEEKALEEKPNSE